MPETPADVPERAARRVMGVAIQNLAAARLGRGFIPLALLLLVGLGRILNDGGTVGFVIAAGAPLTAGAMLAFGQRVVQSAFGRRHRPWMAWALAGGVLPLVYGTWVTAWLGLRGIAAGDGVGARVAGAVSALLGLWLLRSWMKIVELQRLADAMTLGLPGDQEEDA